MFKRRNRQLANTTSSGSSPTAASRPLYAFALEPRILFDAALPLTVAEVSDTADAGLPLVSEVDGGGTGADAAEADLLAALVDLAPPAVEQARTEIIVIDGRVRDRESLLAGAAPDARVIVLDGQRDGVAQIADALEGQHDIDALHIVSHGRDGTLLLGSTHLKNDNLDAHQNSLNTIGQALADDGDILLYGCNVAHSADGTAFVEALAEVTDADVAASANNTGPAVDGGDWHLEIAAGSIQSGLPFSTPILEGYLFNLETITVTTASDVVDANDGVTSLREAIADAGNGAEITFAPQTMGSATITLAGSELVVGKDLTIDGDLDGDGTADITVDADYKSRVFNIQSGTVVLDGLVIKNGTLTANDTNALGAGIFNAGVLTIKNSTIRDNTATGGIGSNGVGGLYSVGSLTITAGVQFVDNSGTGGAGDYGYNGLTGCSGTTGGTGSTGGSGATGGSGDTGGNGGTGVGGVFADGPTSIASGVQFNRNVGTGGKGGTGGSGGDGGAGGAGGTGGFGGNGITGGSGGGGGGGGRGGRGGLGR
jgi:hypothetical protein